MRDSLSYLDNLFILLSKIEVVFVLDGRILWYKYVDFDLHRLDFEYCKGCV